MPTRCAHHNFVGHVLRLWIDIVEERGLRQYENIFAKAIMAYWQIT